MLDDGGARYVASCRLTEINPCPQKSSTGICNFSLDAEQFIRQLTGRKLEALIRPELIRLSRALTVLLQAAAGNGAKPSQAILPMLPS
jgi:hypothetical protein